MKRVAIMFMSAPHGSSAGREGLDALLATSVLLTEGVGVFFVGDGVLQVLKEQRPAGILARDYIATFKLLPFYNIKSCWLCAASWRERGLTNNLPRVLDVELLEPDLLRQQLNNYNVILRF